MDWYWLNVHIVELDWTIRHSSGEYLQKIPRIRFECSNSLLILLEFANTRAIWKTANGRKCLRTFANSWKCSNNRKFQRIQCEFKIFGDRKKERMFVFQMSEFLAQNLSNARKYLEYFVNFRILRKRMNFLRPNCNTKNVFFFCLALMPIYFCWMVETFSRMILYSKNIQLVEFEMLTVAVSAMEMISFVITINSVFPNNILLRWTAYVDGMFYIFIR